MSRHIEIYKQAGCIIEESAELPFRHRGPITEIRVQDHRCPECHHLVYAVDWNKDVYYLVCDNWQCRMYRERISIIQKDRLLTAAERSIVAKFVACNRTDPAPHGVDWSGAKKTGRPVEAKPPSGKETNGTE